MKDSAHLKGFGRLASLLIAQRVSPGRAFSFASFVEKLVKCRGSKGALLYLDSLGDQVRHEVTGWKPTAENPTWVRRSHIAWFKQTRNKQLLYRLTKIKRHLVSTRVTQEQVSKFLTSTLRCPPDDVALFQASAFVQRGVSTMIQYFPRTRTWKPKRAFIAYVRRELSKGLVPNQAYSKALSRIQEDLWSLDDMGWLDDREVFTLVVEALHPLNRDEVDRLRRLKPDTRPIRPYAGTIHGDQEPALKCRFYASPLLLIQCILEPLKDFFMGALRNLENDACFMQESAVHTVAGWLAEGKTTWSYDQGDATNNTPVKLAYVASTVIASLIHRSEVFRCFRWCNEARWLVSKSLAKSFGVDEITWSVGQPLGTGPSFGAYSVAHHALIRGICLHLGVPFTCYVILGDDIVICHEKVAAKYHELITLLGVPISLSKSFVSDKIAEFAGFTIQHNQQFRPGKWREVTGDSLLNLIVEPGYDYKRVVPKFWVPLIERMMSTPYPYGLASLDLTSLTDDELSDYALTCCLFFFKSFVPPDESEVENLRLFTDDLLSWEFFHETKLDQLIYGDQDDNRSPRSGGRTVSNACDVLRSRWRTESCRPRHFNYAPDGNLARLFWRPCEVSALFARATTDNKWLSESGRRSFTREQVSLFLKVFLVLPDGVIHTLNGMFSLINSFIRSYSPHMTAAYGVDPDTLVPLWISQTPFLRELYKDSLVEPSPLAVIRDLIAGFPYYGLGDFTHIPSTFISLIRRYARQKDVLPSNRAPMPHRNMGVGSKG